MSTVGMVAVQHGGIVAVMCGVIKESGGVVAGFGNPSAAAGF